MTNILIVLWVISLIVFIPSFVILLIGVLLKNTKLFMVSSNIMLGSIIAFIVFFLGSIFSMKLETTQLPEPEISTIEKEFFYISKTENTDIDLRKSLVGFDGELISNNDFNVFYRSEENEITEERIEHENLKFIIVENAEDEKIVIETHTYYEQQNYYSPPKIEEDRVETHYKLYVTEKTFNEIFE